MLQRGPQRLFDLVYVHIVHKHNKVVGAHIFPVSMDPVCNLRRQVTRAAGGTRYRTRLYRYTVHIMTVQLVFES